MTDRNLTLVGSASISGSNDPSQVDIVIDTAYVGGTRGLAIVNIADKENPVEISNLINESEVLEINCVRVRGDYCYITTGGDYFSAIDISDPNNPALASYIAGAENYLDAPHGFQLRGNYAYIAVGTSDALTIIDISDPTSVKKAGHLTDPYVGGANDVKLSGDYAFVTSADKYCLTVVDISDPAAPVKVTSLQDIHYFLQPRRLKIVGDYAFVVQWCDTYGGFTIVDISTPTNPRIVSKLTGAANKFYLPHHIDVNGDYAYINNYNSDLCTYDISSKTNPAYAGGYDKAGTDIGLKNIKVYGSYVYAAVGVGDFLYIFGQEVISPDTAIQEFEYLYKMKEITHLRAQREMAELYTPVDLAPLYSMGEDEGLLSAKEITHLHSAVLLRER